MVQRPKGSMIALVDCFGFGIGMEEIDCFGWMKLREKLTEDGFVLICVVYDVVLWSHRMTSLQKQGKMGGHRMTSLQKQGKMGGHRMTSLQIRLAGDFGRGLYRSAGVFCLNCTENHTLVWRK